MILSSPEILARYGCTTSVISGHRIETLLLLANLYALSIVHRDYKNSRGICAYVGERKAEKKGPDRQGYMGQELEAPWVLNFFY
jgi:hypothetical protein